MATDQPGYHPVSDDTMNRVQFYDCKLCRAIVIDTFEHDQWHDRLTALEGRVETHNGAPGNWRHTTRVP